MASVNKVIAIGNLGKDPEVKYLPNGNAVANFSIAYGEKWKDKESGEQKEHTEWIPLSFYGRLAEVVGEYAKKGDPIYVEGKLSTRKYEKDGEDRYITEVKVFSLQLLGSKGGREASPQQRERDEAPKSANTKRKSNADDLDDDIPF